MLLGASIEIITTASIAAASMSVAAWQGWMMRRSEQLRTQPIVVVGENGEPKASAGAHPVVELFLRNDGAGSAFAVTFGILEGATRHRCQPKESGPHGPGNLPRVMASGARAPAGLATFRCELPFDPYLEGRLTERVYWCRFKNAFGREWETRNSSSEERPLAIERVGNLRPLLRNAKGGSLS